jgi:predicted unusual protein kinase regulating ubiquinone biosynthesis (AarF/ABC1/UbiB family)
MASNSDKLTRLARLGGLTSRVASSYVGQKLAGAFRDDAENKKAIDRAHIDNATRIADTFGKLKGAAMKVGQQLAVAASTMDLPPEVAQALGKLHSAAEVVPFASIKADIEASLGKPLAEAYAWFDPQPLGTASLGQAHAARLHDGTEVVVKVLHRGIDGSVSADLMALKAVLVGGRVLQRDREEMDEIFDELRDRLEEECDYLHEAKNLLEFERLWAGDADIRIPRVHPQFSSERVLTMDRLFGVPVDRFVEAATPAARERAGNALAKLYFTSVYKNRTLHADPHPGNYLFEPDGRVGLVDFGCVKRLDGYWLAHYARGALAGIAGDKERCLAHCKEFGGWMGNTPEAGDALWELVDRMAIPFRQASYELGGPDDTVMDDIPDIVKRIMRYPEVRAPRNVIMLHRSLVGLYSMARKLHVRGNWGALAHHQANYAIKQAEAMLV